MYRRVTMPDFIDAFRDAGCPDAFSREGREALFEYLEQLEEDTDEQIEFNVIEICYYYKEATAEEISKKYRIDTSDCKTADELRNRVLKFLDEHTDIVSWDGADKFVFRRFEEE